MRILMLSWEYPPKSVGGLAPHVHGLAGELVRQGHEVHVVTQGDDQLPALDHDRGVVVHRIQANSIWSLDFIGGIHQLNFVFLEKAMTLPSQYGPFDIVHAHDWLVAFAGRALKNAWEVPMIATIHATEWGRHNGLHTDLQRYISQIEWWLCYESWRVIVCSQAMQGELQRIFQVPADKLSVIPNGVHAEDFRADKVSPDFNRNWYASDHERILLYVGRLVWEKGIQVAIEAMPEILHTHPQVKLVIGGSGVQRGYLEALARQRGVAHKVHFAGYLEHGPKVGLLRAAEVALFPSLYEPFGIVALEAMASNTPVLVSDTGGLGEIIQHRVNGVKAHVNNPGSVAYQVRQLLSDDRLAHAVTKQAAKDVTQKYSWQAIARTTGQLYETVLQQQPKTTVAANKSFLNLWPLGRTADQAVSRRRK
ncbi:glycosyltransferase family 4 protein [Heliophilum fasciatum]|uniref:Glycogen(Starch) synthase n=1 Tax=Heliophilum fasciatum TaxID=35700 RepID=A0A4R2S6V2_9FIRM|nr:glycosyltransferase family 4 protein [Heliophilum fasciatum]MCW2277255.1 glycogen(starch) synthase [Heliophilum fasciatum]TCP68111.1 glycogen(starch) synthase [Heliophilum fasciatum]